MKNSNRDFIREMLESPDGTEELLSWLPPEACVDVPTFVSYLTNSNDFFERLMRWRGEIRAAAYKNSWDAGEGHF